MPVSPACCAWLVQFNSGEVVSGISITHFPLASIPCCSEITGADRHGCSMMRGKVYTALND
ncbi:hypothetical protein [Undibacterium crateris]|uniref:hypothetical protein n=1 Tax=Undibacterium crateris TaxID=2528175 RepID=UPI001389E2C1|nr:hypothetical protein [Undibacterium crateris]NDI85546.1 hypothetical protein [Undibacterium crateris]